MGERNGEIISVLLVHSRQNLVEFGGDRGMVEHPPVEEGVSSRSFGREPGGAASCHDPCVVRE